MNPWGLLILGLGLLLIIIGIKGSQKNVIGALTGKPSSGAPGAAIPGTGVPKQDQGILGPTGKRPL